MKTGTTLPALSECPQCHPPSKKHSSKTKPFNCHLRNKIEPFLHKMTHSHHNQLTKYPSIPIRYCQTQFQPQLKTGLRWFLLPNVSETRHTRMQPFTQQIVNPSTCPKSCFVSLTITTEQAGAELCQAQLSLGLLFTDCSFVLTTFTKF